MLGFIYIMSNESFKDGLIKVGVSAKDPSIRKSQLETTGVPEEFHIEYKALVKNHIQAEKLVHEALSEFRWNTRREFFRCSIPTAVKAIKNCASIEWEEFPSNDNEETVHKNQTDTDDRPLRHNYPYLFRCNLCGGFSVITRVDASEKHECQHCHFPWPVNELRTNKIFELEKLTTPQDLEEALSKSRIKPASDRETRENLERWTRLIWSCTACGLQNNSTRKPPICRDCGAPLKNYGV